MKTVDDFFWKNLEDEELQVIDNNADILEQAIRLMEIDDESIANKEIETSRELKILFGFTNYETLNVIENFSTEEESDHERSPQHSEGESSEDKILPENFRMNNQNPFKNEEGESLDRKTEDNGRKKRKGNFYSTTNSKYTTNIYGSTILDIDGKTNRKELIDKWAQEISLIIQTNSEAYDDLLYKTCLCLNKTKSI